MSVVQVIDEGIFRPCSVELRVSETDTRTFACQTSLRLLPGRRLTALAISEGKKYVIKIYPKRKRSLQEYEQEIAGYELLHSASMEVPARIYHGEAQGRIKIIVYKYISRARTLTEVFNKKPESRQYLSILDRFARQLASLHRSSLIHEDPHLENFLVKSDSLTMLDAGAVRRVTNEALLERNFGLFVAQFPVSWNLESRFIEKYTGTAKPDTKYRDRLHHQIEYWQSRREKTYLKKIYRECTAFHVHSTLFGKLVINRHYKDSGLMELLDDPSTVFDGDGVTMLKEGNSSTVGMRVVNDKEFVIKRYNVKHAAHRLKQIVRETRASRSWRNAHRLQMRGLQTAQPVAMLECVKGRLNGVSIFVMENVQGMNSADYFRRRDISREEKREVAIRMLELINELHQEGIVHGDLKSTNFIIHEDFPVIVDLDAMRLVTRKSSMKKLVDRELKRFQQNWVNDAEPRFLFNELMPALQGANT